MPPHRSPIDAFLGPRKRSGKNQKLNEIHVKAIEHVGKCVVRNDPKRLCGCEMHQLRHREHSPIKHYCPYCTLSINTKQAKERFNLSPITNGQ